jgi:hypothetical protein
VSVEPVCKLGLIFGSRGGRTFAKMGGWSKIFAFALTSPLHVRGRDSPRINESAVAFFQEKACNPLLCWLASGITTASERFPCSFLASSCEGRLFW